MKYFLVNVERKGPKFKYPEGKEKPHKNKGYNPDGTQCIWAVEDDIELPGEKSNSEDKKSNGRKITQLTTEEVEILLAKWQQEKEAAREEKEGDE